MIKSVKNTRVKTLVQSETEAFKPIEIRNSFNVFRIVSINKCFLKCLLKCFFKFKIHYKGTKRNNRSDYDIKKIISYPIIFKYKKYG